MEAGFRTDPIKSAKALKARVRVKKLNNAVYGSDVKIDTSLKAFSTSPNTTDASTQAPSVDNNQDKILYAKPSGDNSPISQVISPIDTSVLPSDSISNSGRSPIRYTIRNPTFADVPILQASTNPPSTTSSLADVPILQASTNPPSTTSSLADELMSKIHLGVKPSDLRIKPQSASASQATVIPAATPNATVPVNTTDKAIAAERANPQSSTIAPTVAPTEASTTAPAVASSAVPSNEQVDRIVSVDDPRLQASASELLAEMNKRGAAAGGKSDRKQLTITLYKSDMTNADPDRLTIKTLSDGKHTFHTHRDKSTHHIIKDQSIYNLEFSIETAIKKVKNPQFPVNIDAKVGETTGLGLEDTGPKLHWVYRVNAKDRNYVMLPAFIKGAVRYYTHGNKSPVVSHDRASQAFLNIVRDVVDRGTFEQKDYAEIESREAGAVNDFIKNTKPIIPSGVAFNTSHIGDINTLRKRYQILVGELAAGNHGRMLKDEMIDILRKLQRLKALPKGKVDDLIKGLDEL